jgi:acylphosphatase
MYPAQHALAYVLQSKALELGVTGWVRNRRDGRVEVTAEGYPEDLEALLKWLHTG